MVSFMMAGPMTADLAWPGNFMIIWRSFAKAGSKIWAFARWASRGRAACIARSARAGCSDVNEVEDPLLELLQIFAEIATDKAKSRAFEVVAGQVEKAVCKELVWSPKLRGALHL